MAFNEITKDELDLVSDLVQVDEENIMRAYSGRFMYGETCFGIVGTKEFAGFMLAMGVIAGEGDGDLGRLSDLANSLRMDNMGRDTIYYFPGWRIEE